MPAGWERTGRNAPCPCGSGKKFKHCHGALVWGGAAPPTRRCTSSIMEVPSQTKQGQQV